MTTEEHQRLIEKLEGVRLELERIAQALPYATTEDAYLRRMIGGLNLILPMAMGQVANVEKLILESEASR